MSKRTQPLSKDVNDYQKYGKNKPSQQPNSQNRSLEYFINNKKTIDILRKKNIKELYPIQCQTFKIIFEGYDIIARDRTGSGKTLAFTLPVLERLREAKKFQHKYPKFLIILPTRQLAIQVHHEIESLRYKDGDDFETYVVYGKTSIEENVRKLKSGVDILVATPGRLNDLVSRGAVRLQSIEVLCLDQADEILKQGFKEEIEKVFSEIHKVNKNKIQILLFSATIPQWLKQLSQEYQSKNTPYINMIKDDDNRTSKTIKHYAVEISRMDEMEVVQLIQKMVVKFGGSEKRILIFCDKKVDVDNLSKNLRIQNEALHGDVHQKRRQTAYRNFKGGMLRCIVATNVAARGLDFPSVDLVIQMRPPLNTQEYIHRSGRTGRAGKQGTCLTFFDRTRTRIISKIESEANIRIEQVNVHSRGDQGQKSGNYSRDAYEGKDRSSGYERKDRSSGYEKNDTRDKFERNDRERRDGGQTNGNRRSQDRGHNKNKQENRKSPVNNEDPRKSYNTRGSGSDRREDRKPERSNYQRSHEEKEKRQSISKSRSFSKSRSKSPKRQRVTSPKRQRVTSPKRQRTSSPKKASSPKYSKNLNQSKLEDYDY